MDTPSVPGLLFPRVWDPDGPTFSDDKKIYDSCKGDWISLVRNDFSFIQEEMIDD